MTHTDIEVGGVRSPKELEATYQLEKDVFGPYGTNNPPGIIELQQQTYPDGFLVARRGGKVLGYCSSEKWKELRSPKMGEDPRKTHSPDGTVFCITSMVVCEEQRGLGIGTLMLNRLVKLATDQSCHTMIVETPRTRSFYEQNGFQLLRIEQDRGLEVAILTRQLDAT